MAAKAGLIGMACTSAPPASRWRRPSARKRSSARIPGPSPRPPPTASPSCSTWQRRRWPPAASATRPTRACRCPPGWVLDKRRPAQQRPAGGTGEGRVPDLARRFAGEFQLQGLWAGGDGEHPRVVPVGRDADHRSDAYARSRRAWTSATASSRSIPGLFRDTSDFTADVTRFCNDLRATKPIDPAQPVMVAGDPQWNICREAHGRGHPGRHRSAEPGAADRAGLRRAVGAGLKAPHALPQALCSAEHETCHCERSEAISRRLRTSLAGDGCMHALTAVVRTLLQALVRFAAQAHKARGCPFPLGSPFHSRRVGRQASGQRAMTRRPGHPTVRGEGATAFPPYEPAITCLRRPASPVSPAGVRGPRTIRHQRRNWARRTRLVLRPRG